MKWQSWARLFGCTSVLAWCGCGDDSDARVLRDATELAQLCQPDGLGLRISEVMANPSGHDAGREWFELYNAGQAPLCLGRAELRIGPPWAQRSHVLQDVGCIQPGAYAVLGDGSASLRAARGGVVVDYAYGNLELPNDWGRIDILCQGTPLAQLTYGPDAEAPSPMAGHSLAWVQQGQAGGLWCVTDGPAYDGRDTGTPGAAQLSCQMCQSGGAWRPQRPLAAGALRIEAGLADPPGPDKNAEWLRVRVLAPQGADCRGLSLTAHVPGRRSRSYALQGTGCIFAAAGATLQLAVRRSRTTDAQAAPFLDGPCLPNQGMWLYLWQNDRCIDAAWLARAPHHAPMAAQPVDAAGATPPAAWPPP